MEPIISIQNLKKTFGNKIALDDIELDVQEGEIFGLLGPSGAGKTTMIKLLTGELSKTGGTMTVNGASSKQFQSAIFKANIGILSDNSALYERLTVYDNL